VKIRGYRVELGEIEAVLGQHPAIASCAAAVRPDGQGSVRLAAYYVPRHQVAIPELKALLQQHLPDYMVPSAFMELPELPKTANGKVDRKRLPDPALTLKSVEGEAETPRTRLERIIAEVWQELLKLERVGVRENFFELGGHSLLAMQVTARVRKKTGLRLDIGAVFEHPTVSGFASHVSDRLLAENVSAAEVMDAAREQRAISAETDRWHAPEMSNLGREAEQVLTT
jgi:hypothetical protein